MKALELSDREKITALFRQYPPVISEHTFTNLFVWRHMRPLDFFEIEGSIIFTVKSASRVLPGRIIFGPPLGDLEIRDALSCFDGPVTGAIRLPAGGREDFYYAAAVEEDRDNADYVYLVEDLATLAGRRFAKKRNHIKGCLNNYSCRYEPITAANIAQCKELAHRWCVQRQCHHEPGLCGEYQALNDCLDYFAELDLLGGAVLINGQVEAIAIAEELRPEMAVWHFEKANPAIPGLGQLINKWFAEFGLQDFKYVNREQDLGVPGLRQAKESYYPDHLVEKKNILLHPQASFPLKAATKVCDLVFPMADML
ncbi:MAG: DUF2156 domain-containing protein [Proteobacteria bacterium]|nr:DUF2156 domain-containing protein [Pseudomonadota bacterium]MBU1737064.1 DUF2156 domain-containing protein [Pseudomonadota bacterium]